MLMCSAVSNSMTPWPVAHQAPLCMGILQSRMLEWAAVPFSSGSSWLRGWPLSPVSSALWVVLYLLSLRGAPTMVVKQPPTESLFQVKGFLLRHILVTSWSLQTFQIIPNPFKNNCWFFQVYVKKELKILKSRWKLKFLL